MKKWGPPEDSGRTLNYAMFRACERLDPRRLWGEPFMKLTPNQQRSLLGYTYLRDTEEASAYTPKDELPVVYSDKKKSGK